jgi:hypothetical protein
MNQETMILIFRPGHLVPLGIKNHLPLINLHLLNQVQVLIRTLIRKYPKDIPLNLGGTRGTVLQNEITLLRLSIGLEILEISLLLKENLKIKNEFYLKLHQKFENPNVIVLTLTDLRYLKFSEAQSKSVQGLIISFLEIALKKIYLPHLILVQN